MKKNSLIRGIFLTALLALTITSCVKGKTNNSSEDSTSTSESETPDPDRLDLVQYDPYEGITNHRNMRINGEGAASEQYTEHTRTVTDEEGNPKKQRSYVIENVRALVIPVDFTDYPCDLYGETEDSSREELRKIMFGTREETAWYSLSEYYKSSSFGTCNVTGDVGPWWHTNIKSTSVPKNIESKPDTSYSRTCATDIRDYYRENADKINLADYDANQDGYVDALIMLYTAPITTTGELWWAFCWSIPGAYGKYTPDGGYEGVNRFFWAAFNFFYEKPDGSYYSSAEIKDGTAIADSHTIIHEFGHVLSLPDYYVTDYAGSDYSGLGGLDMMDHNIGDHNAFSKMMYGWINPLRLKGTKGSLTYNLKSTTTTGETIIIPAAGEENWDQTLLSQYIMIEFLTPEGVAELDGKVALLGHYPKYYSKAGVRITHVDARLGSWTYSSEFAGFTYMTKPQESGYYISFACDNTASRSCFPKYKLLELLPANGKSMRYISGNANDDCLYYEGQSFGANGIFENYMMHDTAGGFTKRFGFSISVDKIVGNESATITIKAI